MQTIDLFSGCGGFSLGAHFAGFRTSLAIDIDSTLSSSFSRNFPNTKTINYDLLDLDIAALAEREGIRRPTAVIGGPPCQGFSAIGRKAKDDPRNDLLKAYFRHVSALRPKFFVMENVPGLLATASDTTLDSALSELVGPYTVLEPIVLNAADFGAATARHRVVVVGYDPSCVDPISPRTLGTKEKASTVRDAISDLPSPRAHAKCDERKLDRGKIVSSYAKALSEPPPNGLGSLYARERFEAGWVSGFLPTAHSAEVKMRFRKSQPGSKERVSRYHRLKWDDPSPVLRAGTGSDKGSFQAARPIHPKFSRVITVREAARLQGFPDWFYFHETKWHSHRMIGNSVSPIFAKSILEPLAHACEHDFSNAA